MKENLDITNLVFEHTFCQSLKDWSLGKQLILFPLNLKVSLGSALGNIEILWKQNYLFLIMFFTERRGEIRKL